MSCPVGYTLDTAPRVAPFAAAIETHKPGQRIQYWDNDIIWTENHLPASKLEPLRSLGDPLADDALAALEIKPSEDTLEALLAYTSQPSDKQKSPAPLQLLTHVMTVPEWVDWDSLQRGQQVYWRYYLFMNNAILHFTFPAAFFVPNTTKVLSSTGYLFGRSKQRIFETMQFLSDVVHSLDNLQPGSGVAWKSIIKLRLLHSGVRARFLKISCAHKELYTLEAYGVPINQEDLLGVLFSVSTTMWRMLETRMNVRMTAQEREDYLHLWRYVGYMLGIDDVLGVTQTPERADACLESIMLHLADPNAESGQLCSTMLLNMGSEPMLFSKFMKAVGLLDHYKLHMALTEQLIGPELWKLHELPSAAPYYRALRALLFYLMSSDLWLVTKSPRWLRFRNSLLKKSYNNMMARALGDKRTQFELKKISEERGKEAIVIEMGDSSVSGPVVANGLT
ncbi:hypothetical protein BGZ72_009256 [Mortierella alpina]|nr:hypothetical protein BGZ72_009256 [Mortierella alpina]